MQYEAIYKVQGTLGPIPNVWESTGCVYDSVSCMDFYSVFIFWCMFLVTELKQRKAQHGRTQRWRDVPILYSAATPKPKIIQDLESLSALYHYCCKHPSRISVGTGSQTFCSWQAPQNAWLFPYQHWVLVPWHFGQLREPPCMVNATAAENAHDQVKAINSSVQLKLKSQHLLWWMLLSNIAQHNRGKLKDKRKNKSFRKQRG